MFNLKKIREFLKKIGDFLKKIGDFLKKMQNLPEEKRKIILWSITIIIGLGLFFAWFYSLKTKLKTFPKEKFFQQIGLPEFKEELKEMPEIKIPEMSEEELRQLEEVMKEAEEK